MFKNSTNDLANRYIPQFRYTESFVLLTTLGMIWIISAASAALESNNLSILVLFFGITLFNPLLYLINKMFKVQVVKSEDAIRLLSNCMSIGIPFAMIVGFFPFIENSNLFYPAFGLVFGLIFGIIGYLFRVWLYGLMMVVLVAGCIYIGKNYPLDFSVAGYFTGEVMILVGLMHKIAGGIDSRLVVYKSRKFQMVKQ